jgi:hypothetical protein
LVSDLTNKPWAVADTEPIATAVGTRFIGEGLFTITPVRRAQNGAISNSRLFRVQISDELVVRRVATATDVILGAAIEQIVTLNNDVYLTFVLADSVEEASREGLMRIETYKRQQAGEI